MDKIKFVYQSKLGVCPCSPGRKLIVTTKCVDGTELTLVYGDTSIKCPYCNKLWKNH